MTVTVATVVEVGGRRSMCGAQIFGTDPAGPNAVPGDAGWFTEGSRVRMYSGRRPEDDGDGAIGATGRLRG